ncbi:MAG: sigma-54-dependent transcriptional regulator [Myxococcota bacterium]
MKRALVVDDDRRTRRVLQIVLERLHLESIACENAPEALEALGRESVAIILTDLEMPRMNGIEFMRRVREVDADVPIIVLTAYGTVESAVEAMKLGAVDFLAKPFDLDALEILVQRSLESRRHRVESRYIRQEASAAPDFADLVGDSAAMVAVYDLVRRAAPARSAVLITGETGTGKERIARALHRLSPRAGELFVPLNCAAIPGELLESELFGHVRGAFSGAHTDRTGKFQAADGGTLFLDEIGDMDLGLQAKLLRVLQEGVIEPVGSNRSIPVDVRIVSSTNRDLEKAMEAGTFREDLFYRLNVLRIEMPPLRERREDIPALAAAFLAEFGREMGMGELRLGPDAARVLERMAWKGNVRELRNLMERAVVLADGDEVDAEAIERLAPATAPAPAASGGGPGSAAAESLAGAVAEAERRAILRALAETGDNKAEAARLLGIGERTLWTKLKKHGL